MAKANMRTVAAHASVSVATVSHVINNTRFVAEQTRQRVLNSIQELDYSPDAMARIFKTGRKNLIGFIVPDIANNFFAAMIEEIESVIGAQNFRLIVANTKETKHREIETLRVLASGIVDGLIIASTLDNYAEISNVVPEGLPVVFVDRSLPGCPCDSIIVSNYRAMYKGVETLILAGHRRIGYITGLERLSTTTERLSAYRDAMAAYQLPVEDSLVRFGDSMSKSAVLHTQELLQVGCTALVVSNNVMADDVLFYLSETGLHPGTDIALVGYNDSANRQYGMRKINTISQPVTEVGRTAGQQILERIATPDLPVRQTVLQAIFTPHT